MRPPALAMPEIVGLLQDFAGSLPATKGLIAAPWTPLASSLFPLRNRKRKQQALQPVDRANNCRRVVLRPVIP
jgi:hypothetical protein